MGRLLSFLTRVGKQPSGKISQQIEDLIEERQNQDLPIERDEEMLLKNIFALGKSTAEDIRTPRADVVAIDVITTRNQLIKIIKESGYSRFPVYRGHLDDILGYVHIRDVLNSDENPQTFKLKELVRPVIFAVPSMRILDLLLKMRQEQTHMSMVIDEFGGVDGLITIEDIVEQIVGQIEDEHDVEDSPMFVEKDDGSLITAARAPLEQFEAWLAKRSDSLQPEEKAEVDTIGGFVCFLAGRIPTKNEIIPFRSGLEFEILDGDPRRVKTIRVRSAATLDTPTPPPSVEQPASVAPKRSAKA